MVEAAQARCLTPVGLHEVVEVDPAAEAEYRAIVDSRSVAVEEDPAVVKA